MNNASGDCAGMVAEEFTRRLVAIVAADVAGYSRLVSADEEATLAALRSCRRELIDPKITEYKGRIANTAGDSILIEFPSVIEALRCAVDIQHGMAERNADIASNQQINFRIGINVGDVVEQNGDLLGDGVNVAARLEGLAQPGGICLSGAARDHVRDRVEEAFADMGEVQVKNIARPIRVFQVLAGGGPLADAARSRRKRFSYLAGGITILAAVVLGAIWWLQPWPEHIEAADPKKMAFALPDKPSIAVLAFDNLSDGDEQSLLGDGIAEAIITALSRSAELFVIARNSSFTYKGKPTKVQNIAEELVERL
jgi:adenylate cyclase